MPFIDVSSGFKQYDAITAFAASENEYIQYEFVNYSKYIDTIYSYNRVLGYLTESKYEYKNICNEYGVNVKLNLKNRSYNVVGDIIQDRMNVTKNFHLDMQTDMDTFNNSMSNTLQITLRNNIKKWQGKTTNNNGVYRMANEIYTSFNNAIYGMTDWAAEEINQIRKDDNDKKIIDILSNCMDTYLYRVGMTIEEFEKVYNVFKSSQNNFETFQPYIEKVVNHWYKDLYFEDDGTHNGGKPHKSYDKKSTADIEGEYRPQDESIMDTSDIKGTFRYEGKVASGNVVKQISQPIQYSKESWHYMVKNWLKYGYYFIYDGTTRTADEIILAKEKLAGKYNPNNPLLINVSNQEALNKDGGQSVGSESIAKQIDKKAESLNKILENNGLSVRLQRIDFEKKSALTAFSMLEGMHTEDSEYIYRDLKEFLIELGYFTRADFETIETDVFKWLLKGYKVYKDEWPDPQYEINATEYGTFIRSKASLDAQKNDERQVKQKEIKKNVNTNTSLSSLSPSVGTLYTATTGVTYNVFYQNSSGNDQIPYSQGTIWSSACGATSVAMLMSAYGSTYTERDVAQYMTEHFPGGETNVDNLRVAIKEIANLETTYYAHGENAHGVSASDNDTVERVLRDAISQGKPAIITRPNHYMVLVGLTASDNVEILNPWMGESNYSNYTLRQFIDNIMDTNIVIPNEIPTGFTGENNSVKKLEGFKAGLKVIAPETGVIEEIGTIDNSQDNNTNSINNINGIDTTNTNNENNSNYEVELEEIKNKHMQTEGSYIIIKFKTGNGVDNWKMKIEGLTIDDTIATTGSGGTVAINKGDVIGKTNDGNMKIILYDDKDAIIDDVSDYFKLPKRGQANNQDKYAFFYYIPYESGHPAIRGNGPECVGKCSEGEYAIGINQWTSMNSMCNIQILCEKLYNLDQELCEPLKKYIGIDNGTLISKYLTPDIHNCQMQRDLDSISNVDRDRFMELQMQIAQEELCGVMDNLGLSWVRERPSVVQGTLGSLINWGPYLGWENVIDDTMEDEEIIIELMKYASPIGSTAGNLSNRWNPQAKLAIDILNGVVNPEQLLKNASVFAPYSTGGQYSGFLSSYNFTNPTGNNNNNSKVNQVSTQGANVMIPESVGSLLSKYNGEFSSTEIIQSLNDLSEDVLPRLFKELRNSSEQQIKNAYKDPKNVKDLGNKKISIPNETTFVKLIGDIKKIDSDIKSEVCNSLTIDEINMIECEIDKNSVITDGNSAKFTMRVKYPYGTEIKVNLRVKNKRDGNVVIEVNN